MLATCTGANCGASWMTTCAPFLRSMTRRSSAAMSRQALAGASATISDGILGLDGGAAATSRDAETRSSLRITHLPQLERRWSSRRLFAPLSPADAYCHFDAPGI